MAYGNTVAMQMGAHIVLFGFYLEHWLYRAQYKLEE